MPRSRRIRSVALGLAALAVTGCGAHPVIAGDSTSTAAPPAVTPTAPLRLAASATALSDGAARVFRPDGAYATGGQLVTSRDTIARTASPLLYQLARLGGTGYTVPVSQPGTYFVDLFVAETRGATPGQRVWDVTAEGTSVATAVDVARDAGPDTAFHVLFAVPVTDGTLDLAFAPRAGEPLVGAIEVDYQSDSTRSATLFSDDFTSAAGASPDRTRWGAVSGGGGWGNHELQYYTKRTDNVATDGAGNLALTARKETYTGYDGITRNYTSGRVQTRGRFSFRFGSAVARMRVPVGQGLLPAFWGLGSNIGTIGWPACGEIDVVENLGSEPTTAHAVVHGADSNGEPWLSGAETDTAAPLSDGFHTYGLVWGPNAVTMTLDGRPYMAISASDLPPGSRWGLNHRFYLLLSLAVGGRWPGPPDSSTAFPATLLVDYVRVTA
jgi:beta-glucanase (GH16 family)